jgi:hypothetical protein
VVKSNLKLLGVMAPSSPISQQLVQPVLIHGILALDPSKVSNKTVVKSNLKLLGVMAPSSPLSQQLVQPVLIHDILALDSSKVCKKMVKNILELVGVYFCICIA